MISDKKKENRSTKYGETGIVGMLEGMLRRDFLQPARDFKVLTILSISDGQDTLRSV